VRRLAVSVVAATVAGCTVGGAPAPGQDGEIIAVGVRVEDGDSLVATIDGLEERVRLAAINAPERDECGGAEARAMLSELVGSGPVRLVPAEPSRDRYGRLLAHVFAGGELVNEAIVAAGLAFAMTSDDHHADRILAAEERAVTGRTGLWSPDACGAGPVADVSIVAIEWDPPGPDDEALDEEYVVIEAGEAVDLSGWVLRDESTVNRFVFPPGTRLEAGERIVVVSGCEPPPGALGWCSDQAVWNNTGDAALLLHPSGRPVDRLRYQGR
jgi:endonuclease YncB( thermonuclease family)